jgi:GNAT superfamily N-acetyltransferase
LRDGTLVTLRPIRPSDAAELAARFTELSPESRHQRFLGAMASLEAPTLHYLTEVDGWNHVALVALRPGEDGRPRGIGVARFIRNPRDPALAEPAITVCDADQGRGVGTLLAQALARAARARGVRRFCGPILSDNQQVRRLLASFGGTLHGSADGMQFEVALDDAGDLVVVP